MNESDIRKLAERKAILNQTLEAISMSNIYGKSIDQLTDLNVQRIKAQKELWDVEAKIKSYIETSTN